MKKLLSILICLIISLSSLSVFACANPQGDLFGSKQNQTYTVSIDGEIENGALSVDKSLVKLGESVTFTVTPASGYVLAGLYLNGGKAEVTGRTYTVENVLRDFNATCEFAKESVILSYQGDGADGLGGKVLAYGDQLGELATPSITGSYFIGWQNADGEMVNEYDVADVLDGQLVLTAVYGKYDESLKEYHTPFSITTSFYDAQATEYGVAWHVSAVPVNPVLLAVEGDGSNFENANSYDVDVFRWKTNMDGDEYIVSGVVDGLKFDTEYSVKFGDYSIDAWSDVYTFTTRKENIDDFGFIYITDSQETNHYDGEYSAVKYTLTDATTRFPNAQFIAHGGDVVQNGTFPCAWKDMLLNFDETHFTYPIMPTTGNHERYVYGVSAEPNNTNVIFKVDYPGNATGENLTSGVYYSFDYGSMHFISLSSNDIYRDGRDLDEIQLAWIRADVAKARQNPETKWVVVMTHHAIFPQNTYEVDKYYTPQLMKLLDELNVDLVLFGHGHTLAASHPLVWDDNAEYDELNFTNVSQVTTTTEAVTFDGDTVEKYVYANGTTDYGTVLYEGACSGSQTGTGNASLNVDELPSWRAIWGGKRNPASEIAAVNNLAMYTYVNVSNDQLVVRTYGVDFTTQKTLTEGEDVLSTGYYMDGFMLTR